MFSHPITKGVNGTPHIPGDKSISHRSIIIPSVSNGISEKIAYKIAGKNWLNFMINHF